MAITNIFLRKAPSLGGIEFDAVLEDTLDASVTFPGYEIELGARAVDHRIIQPIQWSLLIGVSNSPLGVQLTDFAGILSNAVGGAVAASVSGLAAGFLGGSNSTRAAGALSLLLNLMYSGEPFDVYAGDIDLSNMVISRINRVKTNSVEDGLIVRAYLEELPTVDTLSSQYGSSSQQLNSEDPAASQFVSQSQYGYAATSPPTAAEQSAASEVLN